MAEKPEKWDLETEVLVVGSGGGALSAAILAHDNAAKVTVIERSDKVGGTTADSGGLLWVPQHHLMDAKGASDSRDDALKYCKALAKGRSSDELVEKYVDTAPEMAKYMEDHTPLKYEATSYPAASIPQEHIDAGYSATITALPLHNPDNGIQKITVVIKHDGKEIFTFIRDGEKITLEGYKVNR